MTTQRRPRSLHMTVMAMAVAANAVDGESTVSEWDVVATSYPEFVEDLARLTGAGKT